MRSLPILLCCLIIFMLVSCSTKEDKVKMSTISKSTTDKVVKSLINEYGDKAKFRIEKGVNQAAAFWTEEDGSEEDFMNFCKDNFINDDAKLDLVFQRLNTNFEILYGHLNKISLDLNIPIHLDQGDILPIDEIFGAFEPRAHLTDDFFKNKIAFMVLLNFPHYTLTEKNEMGTKWSRKEWAYARMGDIFTSRVPAQYLQKVTESISKSDSYISEYNIYVGNLIDDKGVTYFPKDLKLISHWNLRDELKSQYAKENGFQCQNLIYQVMLRIINQEIPSEVINKNEYMWNPVTNKLFKDSKEVKFQPEPNTRYKYLLDNFLAVKDVDPYCPYYKTYIDRQFEEEMEMPQEDVEKLFVSLVSSPTIKKVAELIKKRLGRKLEPFDIWYDGFKTRSTISEDVLNKNTKTKYPNTQALKNDLPNILLKLGFTGEKAVSISDKIEVDAARGAGHAWGAEMKSEKARLRTRVGQDGMNYKGYNIAVHEFGHNVEQTITLQDVDYYILKGVPNTAFTEAWAFVFQKRDLELLGINENNPNKEYLLALDNLWSSYEIMGVSLVDMQVWKWLYKNPKASPRQLNQAVVRIAKEVWNKYYAEIFGIKDQPILAIYSHMIDNPLYLSNYPIGHLIEFQMENNMKGKNLADEMFRMLTQGSLTPNVWMKGAVGDVISTKPTLDAAEEALKYVVQ